MYLEYINSGYIFLSVLMILILLLALFVTVGKSLTEDKEPKGLSWIFIAIAVAVIIPLYNGYSSKHTIDKNIKLFTLKQELRCRIGFNSYLVSYASGWRLKGESFYKNDLLVDALYCEKEK